MLSVANNKLISRAFIILLPHGNHPYTLTSRSLANGRWDFWPFLYVKSAAAGLNYFVSSCHLGVAHSGQNR